MGKRAQKTGNSACLMETATALSARPGEKIGEERLYGVVFFGALWKAYRRETFWDPMLDSRRAKTAIFLTRAGRPAKL